MPSLCFVFLTVVVMFNTRVQGAHIYPKVPSTVEACIGSHATISCTFRADVERLKVTWYFHEMPDFNKDKRIDLHSANGSSQYHEEREKSASYLTIRNVTLNDRGWYFCEVTQDIPQLFQKHSNGTYLFICK